MSNESSSSYKLQRALNQQEQPEGFTLNFLTLLHHASLITHYSLLSI
jgi:hypothetical protein